MFLDTVNINGTPVVTGTRKALFSEAWQHSPHTALHHHGGACCETAKAWLLAMDYSQLHGCSPYTGPRWIRQRYDWGPSKHPIYWCEAVKQKKLDCGVLAALAHECFTARGVKSYPVQMVQQYSKEATEHWNQQWQEDEASTHWIKDDIIYHEGCAVVLANGEIKLWDASAAWWMKPSLTTGYGSLAAVRIYVPNASPGRKLQWGHHQISPNVWVELAE